MRFTASFCNMIAASTTNLVNMLDFFYDDDRYVGIRECFNYNQDCNIKFIKRNSLNLRWISDTCFSFFWVRFKNSICIIDPPKNQFVVPDANIHRVNMTLIKSTYTSWSSKTVLYWLLIVFIWVKILIVRKFFLLILKTNKVHAITCRNQTFFHQHYFLFWPVCFLCLFDSFQRTPPICD